MLLEKKQYPMTLYLMKTFKTFAVYNSIERLNFYRHYQLFGISPLFKTLVLLSIFLFWSIYQLLCHIFFCIAVYHCVTLHTVSKLCHRHNKQNSAALLSINIVEIIRSRPQISKVTGGV